MPSSACKNKFANHLRRAAVVRRIGAADGLGEGICVDAHQLVRAKAAGNFGARAGERSFFFNDTATTEIYTFPYTTLFRSSRLRTASRSTQTTRYARQHWYFFRRAT